MRLAFREVLLAFRRAPVLAILSVTTIAFSLFALGLFGLVAVIVVYLVLVERGLRTSLVVRDAFGKLLAAGLAFAVAWQVFVVLGGVTGLLPLTGLTTPFLAYGGSSLVANFGLVALLVRISDAARRPAAAPSATPPKLTDAPTEVVRP